MADKCISVKKFHLAANVTLSSLTELMKVVEYSVSCRVLLYFNK